MYLVSLSFDLALLWPASLIRLSLLFRWHNGRQQCQTCCLAPGNQQKIEPLSCFPQANVMRMTLLGSDGFIGLSLDQFWDHGKWYSSLVICYSWSKGYRPYWKHKLSVGGGRWNRKKNAYYCLVEIALQTCLLYLLFDR